VCGEKFGNNPNGTVFSLNVYKACVQMPF